MKNKSYEKINILIVAAAVLLCLVMLFRSGIFAKTPKVEVFPDNCYQETLYVITDEDYRPYSFYDSDGNMSGHDVELITLIANRLGMNLDLRFEAWNQGISDTLDGQADVLMTCDYTDSFGGTDQLIKSQPISMDDFIVYSKNKISSVNVLYGERIAIMKDGNVTPLLHQLALYDDCILYPDNRQAMQALANGDVDYAIMRQTVGTVILNEIDAKGISGYIGIGQSYMCFGINENDAELAARIDDALLEIKKNGELERLREKWLTTFVRPYSLEEILSNNIWLLLITIGLIMLSAIEVLKNYVNKQKELEKEMALEKQLEEALSSAEAANRSKSEFLFNMSHDIRTPMNAILGFTDIALRHKNEPERVQDSLKKIKTSGGHLLSLINDILEMSRIEAGKLELVETPLDTRSAIETVGQMSHALAIPKSIDFKTVVTAIRNPYVYADELHINEVLINLISNAIKYTDEGGKVEFRVEQAGDVEDGKVWYRFDVQDTGIGMSEDFQKHLFEAFSREESASVAKREGAGLGLSIVKRIVDMAGGSIKVNSKTGEGSTFTVELPFRVMDAAAIEEYISVRHRSESTCEDKSLANRRLLLVEDNEMNREIAPEILEDAGLVIETAEDGAIAVDMVKAKGIRYYDFILMDIQMPVMNGYQATAAIRSLPGGEMVPIIALSANAFKEDVDKSLDAGMNAHVAKPIDVENLLETMHMLMS